MFLSEWHEFPSSPCLAEKKKLDDSSRLDVVEIAIVPDMLPSLFPSWSGLRTYQHHGIMTKWILTFWGTKLLMRTDFPATWTLFSWFRSVYEHLRDFVRTRGCSPQSCTCVALWSRRLSRMTRRPTSLPKSLPHPQLATGMVGAGGVYSTRCLV